MSNRSARAPATTPLDAEDRDAERAAFRDAVLDGLRRRPRTIPSKFLYDAAGSRLFEEITRFDDYYPTRIEIGILRERAGEIARHAGAGAALVEFGSGSDRKVRLLLDALERPRAYVPIDISRSYLEAATAALARDYPRLPLMPVHADFTRPVALPDLGPGPLLGFFPGSTIGNFLPAEAAAFLRDAARTLGPGALMAIGADLRKDPAILHRAYDDPKGVTACFDLNLLKRINRELGGTFDTGRFAHRAPYDATEGRVEMHLESLADQEVRVAGERFAFAAGETIHTENSYKFTPDGFAALARGSGWAPLACWTDPREMFSVHLLRAGG